MGRKDLAAATTYAQKYKESSDPDPQNAYLEASILWAAKDFDKAIAMAKDIISKSGGTAKARVYKLIADAMVQKGDSAGAKPFIDDYFAKAEPDEVTALDFGLKANIYSTIPGQEDVVFNSYLEGVKADTVIDNKVELLKKGAAFFKAKGLREKEGDLLALLIQTKPKVVINEIFDATRAYYFGQAYPKSLDMSLKMIELFPNEVYGYQWKFNNLKILDSSYTENKLIPAATEYFEFSQKDTAKYKKDYLSAAGFLLSYYANEAKDGVKALEYLNKMLLLDPTNENLLKIKPALEKSAKQPPANKSSGTNQPVKAGSGSPGAGITRKKEINTV